MKSVISRWNFDTPASLLHIDDRISNIEGVSVMPADGHDSFLSCYLPSKITCPPAQYPLLFSTRGKQAERGPHARLSGCISISRPALISKINWQRREIFKFLTQDVTIILSPHLLHQNSRWKLFSVSEIVTFSVIHQMLIALFAHLRRHERRALPVLVPADHQGQSFVRALHQGDGLLTGAAEGHSVHAHHFITSLQTDRRRHAALLHLCENTDITTKSELQTSCWQNCSVSLCVCQCLADFLPLY